MKRTKRWRVDDGLKLILQENHIEFTEPELNELAWDLEIPHGYNCPCCMARFYPLRMKNESKARKESRIIDFMSEQ